MEKTFLFEMLIGIIGGLILIVELLIGYIVKSIKTTVDKQWEKIGEIDSRLSKLEGAHEMIMKEGKHD